MAESFVAEMRWRLGLPRLLLILLLNLIPVCGVVWLGWNAGQILVLYWAENVIIGATTLTRIRTAQQRAAPSSDSEPQSPEEVGTFFIMHYGVFTLVHGVLTMVLAARILGGARELWDGVFSNPTFYWAVLGAAVVQVVILFRDWWSSGLWRRSTPFREMFRPYGRIVVLHVTVLAAAWWISETSPPVWAVLILCLMKAVVELVMTALTSPRDPLS